MSTAAAKRAGTEDGGTWRFPAGQALRLDSGATLQPLEIAYKTYGRLNAEKSNAVLVCHALTGDQHLASTHPMTGKPGWWDRVVGPGKTLDPDRYFIICTNVIGGCMGSTGPASINPETGQPYALSFPVITIGDMVRAQAMLVEAMGIDSLFAVVGGSMGGMQALQWAADYPEKLFSAVCIAAAPRHSAQNIAFHEVGRQAIMADPDWRGGAYQAEGVRPEKGLAVARTSPTSRKPPCSGNSAASCSAMASRGDSTPTSRWRATCATRGRASSTASTPTPTSTSPARWTTSTWRPSTTACWRAPSGRRGACASACSRSPPTGSIRRRRAATSSAR
jgi:pimeloyl-ACP methyl ester carboxylesterase